MARLPQEKFIQKQFRDLKLVPSGICEDEMREVNLHRHLAYIQRNPPKHA